MFVITGVLLGVLDAVGVDVGVSVVPFGGVMVGVSAMDGSAADEAF